MFSDIKSWLCRLGGYYLQRCDADGVPSIVQGYEWSNSNCAIQVFFFDGNTCLLDEFQADYIHQEAQRAGGQVRGHFEVLTEFFEQSWRETYGNAKV